MIRRQVSIFLTVLVLSAGCSRQDAALEQHHKNLESLGTTTSMITEAWLAGDVSGTYTHTALEQTFHLVEQERARLASKPEMLQDPRGAALSQRAESLSRLIASMIRDVVSADGESARTRLASLPADDHKHP